MAEGYKDFIAGTVAGFSGKLLDYPFDTVKVLLQTQNSLSSYPSSSSAASSAVSEAASSGHRRMASAVSSTIQSSTSSSTAAAFPHQLPRIVPTLSPTASLLSSTCTSPIPTVYNGAIDCLKQTIQTRGFLSLYQGLSSPLLGSMAENAVLFLCYGEVKRLLGERPSEGKELSLFQLAMAGGVAGAIGAFVIGPFEVIKVQMQVMNSAAPSTSSSAVGGRSSGRAIRKYNGTIDCVIQTIKNEGLFRGLYRGQTALLLREIPGNFMWYGVYEGVCKYRIPQGGSKRDLGVETHLLGGASAGVAYWTAFYPADTVGSQMRANPEYASKNFVEVFRNVYRREGWMGLYRGWGITVVRAAPTHALIFAMYEQTMALFRRFDSDSVDYIDTRSGSISH
ncbi:hypothetical protein ACHAXH_003474 [Discostella pseudostelligera]